MLTREQQELRRSGIGASEIAALAGLSRWATPIRIWESKVGGPPIETSYAMEIGNALEAPIANEWARARGVAVAPVATVRSEAHMVALATPDRAVFQLPAKERQTPAPQLLTLDELREADGLLQVKSSNWRLRSDWGDPETDAVPEEVLCQVLWELGVTGLSLAYVAVDFAKTEVLGYRVSANPEAFGMLLELAARFWRDHVMTRKPPPPDASDDWAEHLRRWFPRETSADVLDLDAQSDPEVFGWLERFVSLRAAAKSAAELKEQAYQALAQAIGTRTGFRGDWGKLTYKATRERTHVDWERAYQGARYVAELALQTMPAGTARDELIHQLTGAEVAATSTKAGHRQMRLTLSPERKAQMEGRHARIPLSLPKSVALPSLKEPTK